MRRLYIFILMIWGIYGNVFENYVLIRSEEVEVKIEKDTEAATIRTSIEGEKFQLASVDKDWVEVFITDEVTGYIERKNVSLRELQEDKAKKEIESLNLFIREKLEKKLDVVMLNNYTYDPNLTQDKIRRDFEGKRLVYGVKAFENPKHDSKWIYIGDRQIVAVEDWDYFGYVKITVPQRKGAYYVPIDKFEYSTFPKIKEEIKKFIVVDTKYQNISIYEERDKLQLIKADYASTGYDNSQNSFRTPIGSYVVANLKDYMVYAGKSDDNQMYNKGKAPYAIRFSGGNYLHGIPVEDGVSSERKKVLKEWRESLLGTYPLSQGCVRNRDETAKEIFNWIKHERDKNNYIFPTEVVSVVVIE